MQSKQLFKPCLGLITGLFIYREFHQLFWNVLRNFTQPVSQPASPSPDPISSQTNNFCLKLKKFLFFKSILNLCCWCNKRVWLTSFESYSNLANTFLQGDNNYLLILTNADNPNISTILGEFIFNAYLNANS